MTSEQFFPTRWVLHGMTRQQLAAHVRELRRIGGNNIAKKCVYHAHWVGVYPVVGSARWINRYGGPNA